MLIRLGGCVQGCFGAPSRPSRRCPWPTLVVDGPMAVDMRLTGKAAVAGATAAIFSVGYGLPGRVMGHSWLIAIHVV